MGFLHVHAEVKGEHTEREIHYHGLEHGHCERKLYRSGTDELPVTEDKGLTGDGINATFPSPATGTLLGPTYIATNV